MRNLTLAILIVGCIPPHEPFSPATVPADENTFGKAVRAVTAQGMTIETSDEKSGVITTKWEDSPGFMQYVMHTRWSITIANAQATVDSQCQVKDTSDTSGVDHNWKPCRENEQPEGRTAKGKAIADGIGR